MPSASPPWKESRFILNDFSFLKTGHLIIGLNDISFLATDDADGFGFLGFSQVNFVVQDDVVVLQEGVSIVGGQHYLESILPITKEISDFWGRLEAKRNYHVVDGLLVSTAQVHGLTLVTRNLKDFEGADVPLLNPFES